jgi:hypothetical protein
MPGLLRGMARTAVIAGTATAASNRVSRRQARRWGAAEEQQSPAQPDAPVAPDSDEQFDQLQRLGQLRDEGILTEQEFEAKKHQILGL